MCRFGCSRWSDFRSEGTQGALGNDDSTQNFSEPVQVLGLTSDVTAVGVSFYHSCAVRNGSTICWGNNADGQLGDNTKTRRLVPVQVSTMGSGGVAVTGGHASSCGVMNGGLYCWGDNGYGQLGTGDQVDSLVPVAVSSLASGLTAVTSGSYHACALVNGSAYCWGYGQKGQIGDGGDANRLLPTQVLGLVADVNQISANYEHNCALMADKVYCWGDNSKGKVGQDPAIAAEVLTPYEVTALGTGVRGVSAGGLMSCAVVETTAYCWGDNLYGELGDGTKTDSIIPVAVVFP